jgi:hypothetical protein
VERQVLFLPREHGAYGQMSLPIVTSFLIGGWSIPAVLIALTVLAGFLAHEPLAVLSGGRGVRTRREQSGGATVWLVTTSAIAVCAGFAAALWTPGSIRWSLVLPLIPGGFVGLAMWAKREKSASSEIAVALAFSLVAVPVCLAAGASTATAGAVSVAFATVFVSGTLAVRTIVLAVRGGGNQSAAHATRTTTLLLGTLVVAGLAYSATRTLVPWAALIATVPGLAAATWITLFPPSPSRLRTVGWTLVATSIATALILVAGLGRR